MATGPAPVLRPPPSPLEIPDGGYHGFFLSGRVPGLLQEATTEGTGSAEWDSEGGQPS